MPMSEVASYSSFAAFSHKKQSLHCAGPESTHASILLHSSYSSAKIEINRKLENFN